MPLDRHDLYELCVQSPADLVPFLARLHGREPRVLREDFSGTAAIARGWAARSDEHRAIAVDCDPTVLRRCGFADRVELRCADACSDEVQPDSADVIFVGNFSIGEIGERADLVRYLSRARRRLTAGGVFVCDTYGGESCLRVGSVERRHAGPNGAILHHVWEQRAADPLTGRVVNALHFRVEVDGEVQASFTDAFVYDWRLWSVPELRDAMREAGFASTEVHSRIESAHTSVRFERGLDASFAACVVGRV